MCVSCMSFSFFLSKNKCFWLLSYNMTIIINANTYKKIITIATNVV